VKAKNPRKAIDMLQQSVLAFKIKWTEEKITARSGLALFAEFFEAMGIERLAERYMPKARSGRGFEAIRYIKPLCMSIYGGGESIEDVREIREDEKENVCTPPGVKNSEKKEK
jgi:hypothetical protein